MRGGYSEYFAKKLSTLNYPIVLNENVRFCLFDLKKASKSFRST